jgi:hypothetical protein
MRSILFTLAYFTLSLAYGQDDIPYKNSDEFEVFNSFKLVKVHPTKKSDYGIDLNRSSAPSTVMELEVMVRMTKVNENESVFKAYNNEGLLVGKKKMKEGAEIDIEFGNIEQLKKRQIPHLFTIFIHDKTKQKISKIVIEVLENGAIFVNGEPHGKN